MTALPAPRQARAEQARAGQRIGIPARPDERRETLLITFLCEFQTLYGFTCSGVVLEDRTKAGWLYQRGWRG